MATPAYTDEMLEETRALVQRYGSVTAAAAASGIKYGTLSHRWQRAKHLDSAAPVEKDFALPDLPDELPTADELLKRRASQFARKHAAKEARQLMPVTVKTDGPIGVAHFGDPHIDDDGTDIAALQAHVALCNRTDGLFAACVGDYSNNWVGRLARLYGEQSVSAREAWVLVEWLIGATDWLYLVGGNHDCLDMETEALTRRGWVSYDEIRDDDLVFGRDSATGYGVWQPILSKFSRANTEPMVSIETRSTSMRVTPNHRVLCDTHTWRGVWRNDWRYAKADALPATFRLPVALERAPVYAGCPLSDAQIELAGWILTDGSISRPKVSTHGPRVSIWQSKADGRARIETLLSACELPWTLKQRERPITEVCGRTLVAPPKTQCEYRLSVDTSKRVMGWVPAKGALPEWAWSLSSAQFAVLLNGLIGGDGSWERHDKATAVIHGTQSFLASIQAVAVQHGWRASITTAREKDYRLNLHRKPTVEVHRHKSVTRIAPSPRVWCMTVPHGNFMARRDGKPFVTGNCWSGAGDPIQWIAKQAGHKYEMNGARLELRLPSGRAFRVSARHDFVGTSMWNTAHGPAKAAQMGHRDHVLTCGHQHTSGYQVVKDPTSGLISHALRIASYKTYDRYADEKGLRNQNIFCCPVSIFDPAYPDTDVRAVTVLLDPGEAAEYLTWKRKRWAKGKATT